MYHICILTGFREDTCKRRVHGENAGGAEERLKKEISIQRLAEARGIKLRWSGKELIGLCPFHDDRNPSLSIDPVKNVWDCKGACGEGGDVIRWVARAEGISDTHALELLKSDYATGLRRLEVIGLKLYDLSLDRGLVLVRQGKGKKDATSLSESAARQGAEVHPGGTTGDRGRAGRPHRVPDHAG